MLNVVWLSYIINTENAVVFDLFLNLKLLNSIEYCPKALSNEQTAFNGFPYADDINSFSKSDCLLDDFDNIPELVYIENINSLMHTTTPSIKLYYPEPFVAAPSHMHDDIWFIHILLYQYWLWFIFISLVILFFILF